MSQSPNEVEKKLSAFCVSKGYCVPNFHVLKAAAVSFKSCLVIPVINEGDKLSKLLIACSNLGVFDGCDLIVCDGGSNDDTLCLPHEIAERANILRTLEKTGLSGQLRLAYAFALFCGYDNIVTIDGNGKDNPSSIADVLRLLGEGYDFVQCSRFITGGRHENTPISRYIAIRCLHAPILSFAARFKWTDTTQGFRGYSSSLISSEDLKIFRQELSGYSLLAYLSAAAPRKGFRCIECPSERKYPPSGKVPTKITSLKGNAIVLFTLLKAAFRYYDA